MRRGRYGNRVSFKITVYLPEKYSVERLRHYVEWLLNTHSFLSRVKVQWPAK